MTLLKLIKKEGFIITRGRELGNYSTMIKDGIFTELTHSDGRVIYWGLNEIGKPPTLINPRPKILRKTNMQNCLSKEAVERIGNEFFDNNMNYCLHKEKPEDIFKAMFDKSIIFDYTKN